MRGSLLNRKRQTPTPEPSARQSDAAFVADALREPQRFDLIFDRYFDDIFRFCYFRIGDWHSAEDATSQVFVIAIAGLSRYRPMGNDESIRPWLFGIARNVVGKTWRYADRHPTTPLDSTIDFAGPDNSVETMILDAERRSQLYQLISQLPEGQQELLELRLAGLSAGEIAQLLGKSEESVRKAQSRAVQTMRDRIGEVESRAKGTRHA